MTRRDAPENVAAEPAAELVAELKAELVWARRHTDTLLACLSTAGMYERAVAERHRFVFYLGHLEAFDWNLLARPRAETSPGMNMGTPAVCPQLCRLFAFGIDPDPQAPDRLPQDRPQDWPTLDEVRAFGAACRSCIDALLDRGGGGDGQSPVPAQLLHVAIEHRLMHAETLCYLMHWLPLEAKQPGLALHAEGRLTEVLVGSRGPEPVPDLRPVPESVDALRAVPAGTVTLGRAEGFGWDNEFPIQHVAVPAFRMRRYKVTNGEYLEFVRAGGSPPLFWIPSPDTDGFRLRCMFGEIPLPLSWPVYVTHEQASAFAAWKRMRLPTEAEFHRAAYGSPDGAPESEREYPWGDSCEAWNGPDAGAGNARGNFGFASFDPQPVDAHPAGASALGIEQLVGNGWEWTGTPFAPLPGFVPFPFYPGYSADFFDGQHYVVKGGSARTALRFLRRSFRNWYRPNYRYVYAGFRLVER